MPFACKIILSLLFAGFLLPRAVAAKPNILLIYTDDQGSVDARCYGARDLTTPTMDKLAASGVRFTQRSEERRVGKECRSRWSPYH